MQQAVRSQLHAVAALRDTTARCDCERQRLFEEADEALADLAELVNERTYLSCLQQVRASHECKLAAEQVQLQVHLLP